MAPIKLQSSQVVSVLWS